MANPELVYNGKIGFETRTIPIPDNDRSKYWQTVISLYGPQYASMLTTILEGKQGEEVWVRIIRDNDKLIIQRVRCAKCHNDLKSVAYPIKGVGDVCSDCYFKPERESD